MKFTRDPLKDDGTYNHMPFEEYLSLPIWSQSTIKEARKSAAHALAARLHKTEPTDAMVLGTALHTCFLETDEAADRIVTWEGKVRRGKEWDEFKALYNDKIILTKNQRVACDCMVASMRKSPFVKDMFDKVGDVEVVEIGEVMGLRFKARADALAGEIGIDIKKVANGDPFKFQRAIIDYGYDIQAALYCQLFELDRFILLTVEEEPPYDVVPYELSPAMIRNGLTKLQACVSVVRQAEKSQLWPGRSATPVLLDPPEWDMLSDVTYGNEEPDAV